MRELPIRADVAVPEQGQVFPFTTPAIEAGLIDPGSLTYEPYFGLREKPFSLLPDPRFFFSHPRERATFDALVAGIRRREGILVLTGDVGAGKTTLCRSVLKALDRKTFAAFVPDPFLSREDLLKTLLVDFGVVSIDEIRSGRLQGTTRTDLSYPLYEFLTSLQALQAFAVVIIDEAQNLPSPLLEEIRILADMEDRQKLIQVLLVGQPELQASLSTFEMRQLRQRLSLQCELLPLGREDLGPYIAHRLMVAGNLNTVRFSDLAVARIWGVSNGIPRIVNLVCDGALTYAAQAKTGLVTTDHVGDAINLLKLQEAQPVNVVHAGAAASPESKTHEPRPPLADFWPARLQDVGVPDDRSGLEIYQPEVSSNPPGSVGTRRTALALSVVGFLGLMLVLGGAIYVRSVAPPPGEVKMTVPVPPVQPHHVEPLAVSPAPPAVKPATEERGSFAIQMATLTTPAGAARAVEELQSLGYSAYSREVSLSSGGSAYAVLLGPYVEMAAAQRDLQQAQQVRGYTPGRIVSIEP